MTFTASTRRKPGNPGFAFSSLFGFEHVHTDVAISCLSIENTGVSSEDLDYLALRSRSASDLQTRDFFHGFARVNHGFSTDMKE